MEEKINIAELLKDCPKCMELYSPIYGLGKLTRVTDRIYVKFPKEHNEKCFKPDGKVSADGEIMLFPKGKTTWEGFVPPCKYKAGDVLVSQAGNIVLFSHIDSNNAVNYHCIIPTYGNFRIEENTGIGVGKYYDCVLADEQQRQRMYDRIKCSGYKYNQHINKLEKLVEPKFKVGDRIKNKNSGICDKVIKIFEDCYLVESCLDEQYTIGFDIQDNWKLVPNKFDINTLKPFDKVLVRDFDNTPWEIEFFSRLLNGEHFKCLDVSYVQCIPYEGNQHLLGTTNDCSEFYKTW